MLINDGSVDIINLLNLGRSTQHPYAELAQDKISTEPTTINKP